MTTTVHVQTSEQAVELTTNRYDESGSSHPESDVIGPFEARTITLHGDMSVSIRELIEQGNKVETQNDEVVRDEAEGPYEG